LLAQLKQYGRHVTCINWSKPQGRHVQLYG